MAESAEHKELKTRLWAFLWLELKRAQHSGVQPMFGDITWACADCLRPHVFELLAEAEDVVMEKHLSSALRPDITIMGRGGRPSVLLEVRKTYLSEEAKRFARTRGIPLFVVDVLDGVSEQATLHNRQRRWYDNVPEFDETSRQMARAVEGFPQTVFEPFYDANGELVDAFLHYDNEDPEQNQILSLLGMPHPRRGHYLFAHDSTLGCESQRGGAHALAIRDGDCELAPYSSATA